MNSSFSTKMRKWFDLRSANVLDMKIKVRFMVSKNTQAYLEPSQKTFSR